MAGFIKYMSIDKELISKISSAALKTPDPVRAEKNLLRFIERSHDKNALLSGLPYISHLFAVSQFLANYCTSRPERLYSAISEMDDILSPESLRVKTSAEMDHDGTTDISSIMKALRLFKKKYLLGITLRFVTGKTDLESSMKELSSLADVIISSTLKWSLSVNHQRFGEPSDSSILLVALGKLGGEELNYSSDIDLIVVYENDEGQTSGILNPSGVRFSRISNHEFYCKVVELFSRLLSASTEDGIAYRVDLRLRPQGQKGQLALPLKAYQTYYESWGRTWERMVLIRARPVAGDSLLGRTFMEIITPFVWKKTIDFTEIEEIRGLKKKIDSTLSRDDIKRGYGGIREAEFFVHTFQLLYGGEKMILRRNNTLDAIHALKSTGIIPDAEMETLRSNYMYLRKLEHYLQMNEDLQTHSLPSSEKGMDALSKKMSFNTRSEFTTDLRLRRMQIKNMYNSLLGSSEDVHTEALNLLEGNLADEELLGYLSFKKARNPDKCLKNLKSIREHMSVFRTINERSILRYVVPQLLDIALTAESPDRALAGLEGLLTTYGIKTAHLTALTEQKELMTGIMKVFTFSPYLYSIFISRQNYLDILIEEWGILKSSKEVEERLLRATENVKNIESVLAEFRRLEEIRLGMLFLMKILKIEDLFIGLTQVAAAIIKIIIERYQCKGLSVISMGKLGGMEMTFGSDLDIIFVSATTEAMVMAEKIMKSLTAYTDMGLLYSVDTRLRPDGSKGILVKDIEGYRNYYLNKAQYWELQALLKARSIGGDEELGSSFISMAREVLMKKGVTVKRVDITAMRKRIIKELSHERDGFDVKLGPGGIEEIEFFVQYLQLNHSEKYPEILVQNTLQAANKLASTGLISDYYKDALVNAYEYYRKLETFLRLNEEQVVSDSSVITDLSAEFMEHKTTDEFLRHLNNLRENVLMAIKNS